MAKPPRGSDLVNVLRGLARVASAAVDVRSQEASRAWAMSSLRPVIYEGATKLQEAISTVLYQPQSLQSSATKGASETIARVSTVVEGLRVYGSSSRLPPAVELSETPEVYDPLHDPSVEELNIEELMMQEVARGSAMADLDPGGMDGLGGAQEAAGNIVDRTRSKKDEISKRMEEFESLLEVSVGDKREITEEQLQVLDEKVSELQDISYGHNFVVSKQTEQTRTNIKKEAEGNIKDERNQAAAQESPVSTASLDSLGNPHSPQELTIEGMLMQEAAKGHQAQVLSEVPYDIEKQLSDIYSGVQGAADAVLESMTGSKEEFDRRMKEFEPLLDIGKAEEKEITEDSLQAINMKLSELQDVAFGHDLKIFRNAEHSKPLEGILDNVLHDHHSVKEDTPAMTKSALETEEQSSPKSCAEERPLSMPDPVSNNRLAEAELESSISQVAKPITLDDSFTSAIHEIDVEVQINSKTEAAKVTENVSTRTNAEETLTSSSGHLSQTPQAISPNQSLTNVGTKNADGANASIASVDATAATITSTTNHDKQEATTSTMKLKPKLLGKKPLAKEKPKSTLSDKAQARKVPHSRIGRLATFGGLAAGLGMGTLAEVTRRSLGLNQGKGAGALLDSSPFLTEANAMRIVDTLCRVRGAALKLGQMLSIQDSALINPQLQKIFERVRQSADFMPAWQLEAAIVGQLGEDWRSKVAVFDEKPFAAASIGQVHLATLHDGRSVAMKIQYPGVAEGIESDINNLVTTLKLANIFPEGLFVDSVIEVAKRELRWECDYVREVECTQRFKELMAPYPEFYVPEVVPELCTSQIFTSELIAGIPVDQCLEMDQDTRNFISEQILRVCLMELFQFGFMQTDPNWSNFFYNAETEQLALLDFGACREYRKEFVDKYIHLIHGAATKDREKVLKNSQELGFLTGYEAKVMENAHIDAIMILGEAFQENKPFYFGDQNTTYRIQHLVPVMLSHRMCAPPEESYSLHRKMSGVFLLCAKLKGVVNCYNLFHEVFRNYKFGGTWEEVHAGR